MLILMQMGEGGEVCLSYCSHLRETFFFFHLCFDLSVAGRGGLIALGTTCSSTLRRISPRDAARKEADR